MFKKGDEVLGGRYRVESLAGEKKSCVVFEATRISDSSLVALKVLAPALRKQPDVVTRLRAWADSAMAVEHSNLIPVYEMGEEGDSIIIAERWLEALPLLRVVRGKGSCSPYEAVLIASQLSKGVDHLISTKAREFEFMLSDVYAEIGDLRQEADFYTTPIHHWPGLGVLLSPLALDGEAFSVAVQPSHKDAGHPLVSSTARIIFHLITGGMGDPLEEPVLSESFTASLRGCLTGSLEFKTSRELLWTLFGDFGPEVTEVLLGRASQQVVSTPGSPPAARGSSAPPGPAVVPPGQAQDPGVPAIPHRPSFWGKIWRLLLFLLLTAIGGGLGWLAVRLIDDYIKS